MTPGSKLQGQILMYLEARGYPAYDIITASKSGVADVLSCIEGQFASIEVKYGKDTASMLQTVKQKKIRAAGGYAIIAKSLQDVVTLVDLIRSDCDC